MAEDVFPRNEYVSICPYCAKRSDNAAGVKDDGTGLSPREVKKGDISFCIYCGNFSIFTPKHPNGVRKPTEKEWARIRKNPTLAKLVYAKLAADLVVKGTPIPRRH